MEDKENTKKTEDSKKDTTTPQCSSRTYKLSNKKNVQTKIELIQDFFKETTYKVTSSEDTEKIPYWGYVEPSNDPKILFYIASHYSIVHFPVYPNGQLTITPTTMEIVTYCNNDETYPFKYTFMHDSSPIPDELKQKHIRQYLLYSFYNELLSDMEANNQYIEEHEEYHEFLTEIHHSVKTAIDSIEIPLHGNIMFDFMLFGEQYRYQTSLDETDNKPNEIFIINKRSSFVCTPPSFLEYILKNYSSHSLQKKTQETMAEVQAEFDEENNKNTTYEVSEQMLYKMVSAQRDLQFFTVLFLFFAFALLFYTISILI